MDKYLGNNQAVQDGLVIIGGLRTTGHLRSGGYRLDFLRTPAINAALYPQTFILEAPNGIVNGIDSGEYAVYRLDDTPYFVFYVHGQKFKRGKIARGEKFFDMHSVFGIHLHIKIGSYAKENKQYLEFLKFLDPRIKVTTNYGSTEYTGQNTGTPLPIFQDFINYEMVKLQKKITVRAQGNVSVRPDPRISHIEIEKLSTGVVWETDTVARGQMIEQNNKKTDTWYKKGDGWVSAAWVEEIESVQLYKNKLKEINRISQI